MPKIGRDLIKVMEVMSYDDLDKKIRDLIDPPDADGGRTWRYWIRDTYPDHVVIKDDHENKLFKVAYTVDASENVTLGAWEEAEYVLQVKPGGATIPAPVISDLSEGMEEGEIESLTRLSEAQALGGNKFRMSVLRTGWNVKLDGSPGGKYYTRESIATVVPMIEGAKSFADHPTDREERERPQRSVRELVGYWTDAKQEADGRATATLVLLESAAWLKPALVTAEELNSKGIVFVGPSINGYGSARIGDAEGRRGKIVESVKRLQSIDIVTEPGAGGTVDKLLEGAKPNKEDEPMDWTKITFEELKKHRPDLLPKEEPLKETAALAGEGKTVDQLVAEAVTKEVDKIKEAAMAPAKTAAEELTRTRIKMQVGPMIREQLKESKLPELTQDKLYRHLEARDFAKDGALDETALKEAVTAAVTEERDYLSKLTEAGKITGMGITGDPPKSDELVNTVQAKMDKMFGLPEQKPAGQQ